MKRIEQLPLARDRVPSPRSRVQGWRAADKRNAGSLQAPRPPIVGLRVWPPEICLSTPGKLGEIVQGVHRDYGPFFVAGTLSSSPDSNWVRVVPANSLSIHSIDGGELSKARRTMTNYLDMVGTDPATVTGRVEVHRRTPVGKGRGSSSLDAALCIFGVAQANELPAHPRMVYRALCSVERSDPVWMSSDLVLAQPEAGEFEIWGVQPNFLLVGWDACPQGTVDTQAAAALDRSRRQHLGDYDFLLGLVRSGDPARIQEAATLSACLNDRYLPKPAFGWSFALAKDLGAGLMCAHSGTYLALMLPPDVSPETLGLVMALVRAKGFVPQLFLMGCGHG